MPAEQLGSPLARLELLERQVADGRAGLERLAPWQPVPDGVLALLATAVRVPVEDLPPGLEVRLTTLMDSTAALVAQLQERQRLVAGRLASVRTARRAGPAPNLVDYAG